MKKILFSMMAIAGLFASCQANLEPVVVDEVATVSFEVETPQIATRAYSDGTTATVLQYAVYDANGEIIDAFTKTAETINISKTVELQLTTGNTYSVLFWAAAPNAPYTVDLAAKTMEANYEGVLSNNENLDAFYKYYTFTVKGSQSEKIELKRPFAQLNIGTNDFEASTTAGYTPTQSSVKVAVYSELDLATGAVAEQSTVEFAAAAFNRAEKFPVDGYEYLAMNYLLVDAEKETVDVEFTYTDGTNAKTRTVGSVPVQRNHRTNLYGQLLTSNVDINVEIKPEYDDPAYEADPIYKAAAFGGEVTLTEDVVLKSPLTVQANMAIDLNGYTLSYESKVEKHNAMITVNAGSSFVVKDSKGNGKISYAYTGAGDAAFGWGSYTIANNGTLVVESGIVEIVCDLNDDSYASHMYCAIHQGSNKAASTTVNGGIVSNPTYRSIRINAGSLTVNGGVMEGQVWMHPFAEDSSIEINGGSFAPRGVDGSSVYVENGSKEVYLNVTAGTFATRIGCANVNKVGVAGKVSGGVFGTIVDALIAEGYEAVENAGLIYVVPVGTSVAASQAELTEALKNGTDIYLAAGEYTMPNTSAFSSDVTIVCEEGTVFNNPTLNINGATLVGATMSNPSTHITVNGVYKNCEFTGSNPLRYCYAGETVVFEDCVFSGSTYGVHFDGGANDIVFRNCVISGFNTFGAEVTMLTFEGCTFVGNGKSGYNGANLWGSAKMVNCEFTFNGTTTNEWIDCIGADKTYEFVNCTVNGEAYTSDNYTSYDQIFSRNNVVVKIDGVDCQL